MSPAEPTDRELEALKVLWRRVDEGKSGGSVREVCEAVSESTASPLAYTTVLSLLQVMEQKGLVDHIRQGRAYLYRPLVERRKTFRRLASEFLEKVFDGAVADYLVHALQDRKLSARELDELEAMIAEARAKQSRRRTTDSRRKKSAPARRKKGRK